MELPDDMLVELARYEYRFRYCNRALRARTAPPRGQWIWKSRSEKRSKTYRRLHGEHISVEHECLGWTPLSRGRTNEVSIHIVLRYASFMLRIELLWEYDHFRFILYDIGGWSRKPLIIEWFGLTYDTQCWLQIHYGTPFLPPPGALDFLFGDPDSL